MARNTDHFNSLPDVILLEILKYLPVKERCISGRVCRRWRNILKDNSLWRHVDLLPYQIELRKLWKLIRAHLSDKLRTLRIRGVKDTKTGEAKAPLSESMLEELRSRCTSLSWLHIEPGNVTNISSVKLLPGTLTHLTLRRCIWSPRWLKDSTSHFPNLVYLDLGKTVRIDNHDLADIAQFLKLTTLKLDGCYRVGEPGLQKVAEALTKLEVLNISECHITDLVVHHIARHLKSLRVLDFSNPRSNQLTDLCVPFLNLMEKLETLYVTSGSIAQLQPKALVSLASSCPRLRTIHVQCLSQGLNDFTSTFKDGHASQFKYSYEIASTNGKQDQEYGTSNSTDDTVKMVIDFSSPSCSC